jgi:hypothetical protein
MLIGLVPEYGSGCRRGRTAFFDAARWFGALTISVSILASATEAQILRVVSYNIDADTGGADGDLGGVFAGPGLNTVLKAIGAAHLNGNAQPIDVLALQELNYSRTWTTLDFIITQLNNIYGAGTYNYDTTFDPTTGDFTGNGPSGLVYNTHTVQVLTGTLAPKVIAAPSNSGAPRAPIRYTLAPKGYNDHSADFTIYVSHMKSGSAGSGPGSNGDRRNTEAKAVRDDAFNTLSPNAHIIYTGDYNMDGSSEAGYQTMISSTRNGGVSKAIDTLTSSLTPSNTWDTLDTSLKWLYTESTSSPAPNTGLRYRDDVQYVTSPMLNQPGLQLVSGTLGPFGNNGSIDLHGSVTDSNNTALADLGVSPYSASYRTSVLHALSSATDHYPVVADYSFATAVGAPGDYDHSGVVNAADYTLWRTTYGSTTNLVADGNHNNVVDAGDYVIWRRYSTGGSGAGSFASGSEVPEPATWMLILSGCLAYLRRSRLRG